MTRPGCIAVVDQGSSSTKAGVYAPDGSCLDSTSVRVDRNVDGASVRHDPEQIADGVESVLRQLIAAHRVEAIGLACQRSTCLLWERHGGRALSDALSWQDRSQAERVERLAPHAETVRQRTGLRLSPHYAAPKLAALLESTPGSGARVDAGEIVAGTLDAFLVHRLTGRPSTEPGIAGRTLLYNLATGDWDEELCGLFGVAPRALPELLPSAAPRGTFEGVPVVAVAGDQQASLVGHGGWAEGTVAAHFGTGAFVLASTGESPLRHPGLLTAVLASTPRTHRFQIEGSVNSAGSAVDWACSLTGESLDDWSTRPLDPARLLVLPSFAGTAAPWWRADSSAVIAGLGLESTGADLVAAVLAGVVHRVLDCVDAIVEAGAEPASLRVSGKLTRLDGLTQLLADAGQRPVEIATEEETGSLGLVRLVRAGLEASDEALKAPGPAARRVEPRWSARRAAAARRQWRVFAQRALDL